MEEPTLTLEEVSSLVLKVNQRLRVLEERHREEDDRLVKLSDYLA